MFDWLKKERCKVCREERSVRYCLRRNREIGWQCCNSYRADGKCPAECAYTPRKQDTPSPLPALKSDSRAEFLDFLQHYLQFWMHQKITSLDDNSPQQLVQTEDGKKRLKDWLAGFSYPDQEVLEILNARLGLGFPLPDEKYLNPEVTAVRYLDAVIAQDWSEVLTFYHLENETADDLRSSLLQDLAAHPLLRKVKHHRIINAGFTQDHNQAFVFCELNSAANWTFIFISSGGQWQLYQSISGTLQDYYAQKELFRNLALKLNAKDETAAWTLLQQAAATYPLCPDVFYYQGLYDLMTSKPEAARISFRKALALDPDWKEPLYNLALLELNSRDFSSSLQKWQQLAAVNPTDINVMNNLGVCYLGLNQPERARAVWRQALELDPKAELVKQNLEHLDAE
jgi:tetratricopeptide (TPR) repeat protein